MRLIKQLNIYSLLLAVFFLPIHLNLNNIFLVIFIGLSLILFLFENKNANWKKIIKNRGTLSAVSIPFLLNAIGLIYTDEPIKAFDLVIRAAPFLCIPLIAISFPNIFYNNYRKMGYAIVLGCFFVMVYSWSFSISEILSTNKPFKELFGPLYSHHNLVKTLDLHAAYLSICIYTSIGFIVLEYKTLNRNFKLLAMSSIFILTLFMFHLLSRNAIIYYILASIVFLVCSRKWKVLTIGITAVILLGIFAYNVKHNYLRDRLFNNLNIFEKKTQFSKKDDRFERLKASYVLFQQKPIIGYGTAAESKHRREVFKKNNDRVAYERNYNAHNQFFEYLSTYGIFGGIMYLLFFFYLFYLVYKQKRGFFLFVITGLFFACLTESIFERSQGVIYTSIIIALLISFYKNQTETQTIEKGVKQI